MGTIAAPLLATASVALAAVLLTAPQSFDHLHVALAALAFATFAFIAAIQATFQARSFVVTPSELEEWWPDHAGTGRRQLLRRTQRYHARKFGQWSTAASVAYNLGVISFAVGVTAILAPASLNHKSFGTLLPSCIAAAFVIAELIWVCRWVFGGGRDPELPEINPEEASYGD